MLMIRLQRVGRKNDPSFRMVVTDSKNGPKAGKFIEIVGAYDARKGNPQINADRVKYWMSVGAQTSDTVNNLLVKHKVIEGKKIAPFIVKPKEVAPEPASTDASQGGPVPKAEIATEETPVEEPVVEETPVEEVKTEAPVEEVVAA